MNHVIVCGVDQGEQLIMATTDLSWWELHRDAWVVKLTECVENDEPLGVGHVLALLNDLTSLTPSLSGCVDAKPEDHELPTNKILVPLVRLDEVKRLREALENALTWEGRLNKASQLLSQRVMIEPSKIKIAVHSERMAACNILEEAKDDEND